MRSRFRDRATALGAGLSGLLLGCAGELPQGAPSFTELVAAELATDAATSVARRGDVEIRLLGPDDPQRPTRWEGPIELRRDGGPACRAEAELVSRVFLDRAERALLVVSSSGSTTYLAGFSTADCHALWPERSSVTDEVVVAGDRVETSAVCIPGDADVAECHAAQSFRVTPDYTLTPQPGRARALTADRTGLAFEGTARIRNAGGPDAERVP